MIQPVRSGAQTAAGRKNLLAPQPQGESWQGWKTMCGSQPSKLGFRAELQFQEGEWKGGKGTGAAASLLNRAHTWPGPSLLHGFQTPTCRVPEPHDWLLKRKQKDIRRIGAGCRGYEALRKA